MTPAPIPPNKTRPENARLERTIARKAARRAQSLREGRHSIWFGIGMFGLVGWAVAVPTVAGIALGIWLDRRFPDGPSWALTGLVGGVLLGSFNAWWWVKRTGIQGGRVLDEGAPADIDKTDMDKTDMDKTNEEGT